MALISVFWGVWDKYRAEKRARAREAVAVNVGIVVADATIGPTPLVGDDDALHVIATIAPTLPRPGHKQRGVIAMGWLILAGVIAAGLVLTGLVLAWNKYTTGIDQAGFDRGVATTTAQYTARDNAQLQTALTRVKVLEDAARKTESAHAAAIVKVSDKLAKEKANAKLAEKRVRDAIAAGDLRVRDAAFKAGTCAPVGAGSQPGATTASASGSNGAPRCQLSDATASDLLAIGRDADEVVAQLTAAQAIIVADRAACNAP